MLKAELQAVVVKYVLEERHRQDKKYGAMPRDMSPDAWLVVLTEEVGEVARAIIQTENDNYIRELIQVAAVALAAVEDYVSGNSMRSIGDVNMNWLKYGFNIETIFDENPVRNEQEYRATLDEEELADLE